MTSNNSQCELYLYIFTQKQIPDKMKNLAFFQRITIVYIMWKV